LVVRRLTCISGDILDRKLRHAKEEAEIHQLQYVTFSEKNEAQVKEWKGEVVAWESAWNHQRKELRNPFETVKTGELAVHSIRITILYLNIANRYIAGGSTAGIGKRRSRKQSGLTGGRERH